MKIDNKNKTYTYKRYMRDGSTEERTGVMRTKHERKNTPQPVNQRDEE